MDVVAAVAMARRVLDEHGLRDWTVVLDRARTRAGVCRAHRREIGLSRPLTALHSEEEVRLTVLHEVAHALVGPEHGHDAVWRERVRRIGGDDRRTLPPTAPRLPGAWTGTCPAGHTVTRHRRPARTSSCTRCSRTWDPRHAFTWERAGS
ncbi:SprT-like domain-containing protein [Kineococcus sp. SYSU DK004]|uniref:SprT-like domain-containing protein n=1 Tax=Kineococcus sp. SYSU DK004 TaxID=3383125 RepID=UPI003D7C893D